MDDQQSQTGKWNLADLATATIVLEFANAIIDLVIGYINVLYLIFL